MRWERMGTLSNHYVERWRGWLARPAADGATLEARLLATPLGSEQRAAVARSLAADLASAHTGDV